MLLPETGCLCGIQRLSAHDVLAGAQIAYADSRVGKAAFFRNNEKSQALGV
jgi:hypothetical protein